MGGQFSRLNADRETDAAMHAISVCCARDEVGYDVKISLDAMQGERS